MTAAPDSDRDSSYLDQIRDQLTRYDVNEVMPTEWPSRRRLMVKTMNFLNPLSMGKTPFGKRSRDLGLDWPLEAETMIGMQRLTSLQQCVETIIAERIAGDLVECGVWRGGACILMRAVLAAYGDETRRVWLADSFAGVPPPDTEITQLTSGVCCTISPPCWRCRKRKSRRISSATACSTTKSAFCLAGSRTRCGMLQLIASLFCGLMVTSTSPRFKRWTVSTRGCRQGASASSMTTT
jgi:hypothetical protein